MIDSQIARSLRRAVPRPLRHGLRALSEYPDTWRLTANMRSFRRLRRLENASPRTLRSIEPLEIRFRALGGTPVSLRPGTQDDGLARDVFFKSHHLPPVGLTGDIEVVWDLGANVGLTMAHMATLLPRARILGVELDEENMRLCQRNTAAWGERCVVIHAGVWIDDGLISYKRTAGQEQSFRVSEPARSDEPAISSAPAICLDTLLERTGAPRVDYVKMDIEGAEARVLKERVGWAERVRSIKVEVHAPYTVEQCTQDLERLGFRTEPIPKRRGGVVGTRR